MLIYVLNLRTLGEEHLIILKFVLRNFLHSPVIVFIYVTRFKTK
jgi:hypothetical protein